MTRAALLIAPFLACLGAATPALARDYGQQGAVWPVVEPDLLAQIHARLLSWIGGVLLLAGLGLAGSAPAEAAAGPGRCTGKFVNPITDICWSCLFPISVGGLKIWPSGRPDTDNPDSPVCLCGLRPGIAMGFWEPVRLADVSMKPWCFVNLGGMKLDPGFDIGFKTMAGPSAVGGNTQYNSQWHVHWYAYPLIYWMEIVADFMCLESGSVDILHHLHVGRPGLSRHRRGHGLPGLAQTELLRAMKTHPHLVAVSMLASAAAFAGAAAQTADQGLDLEAIRARAAQEAGEAEALAASARARAEQLAREAKSSADAAEAHGRRFASDPDLQRHWLDDHELRRGKL